jgi:replicative DNA helicase
LQGTDVVILAAPPLVDEASLSLSIALNAGTLFQRGIGLFSLEMNRYQVVQRLLAMSADIDLYRLRTGQLNEEESKQLSIAGKTLAKAHLWIDDRFGPTMDQLQQRVRQLVEIHDVDLIIVDNIHLIDRSMANKANEQASLLLLPNHVHLFSRRHSNLLGDSSQEEYAKDSAPLNLPFTIRFCKHPVIWEDRRSEARSSSSLNSR